jgi:hypothetical protein
MNTVEQDPYSIYPPEIRKQREEQDLLCQQQQRKVKQILAAVGIKLNDTDDRVIYVGSQREALLKLGDLQRLLSDIPLDLNAIRELELMVIGKFGMYSYGDKLFENVIGLFDFSDTQRAALFATADAQTRITAMLAVIEEGK